MKGWLGRLMFNLQLPLLRRLLNGSVRVRVLVWDEEKQNILLVKNLLSRQKWTLPGGGVKRGESPQAAAARELKEELGISIDVDGFELMDSFPHKEEDTKADWQAVILACSVSRNSDLNHRRSELLEHAWFPLGKLPDDLTVIASKSLASVNT